MERLPLPSFLSVLAFAVHDYREDIIPTKRQFPLVGLRPLALVCKSWYTLVREVAAQCQRSTLTLDFSSGSHFEFLRQCRQLTERGPYIVDLSIQLRRPTQRGNILYQFQRGRNDFQIDWHVVFSRLPALQRLDLSGVQLASGQVKSILKCAAKYCKNVEALVLATVDEMLQFPVDFDSILKALYKALDTWYAEGTRRGLRQLTIPVLGETSRFQTIHHFFDKVVKCCPELEYLDGYKKTLCELDKLTCGDNWYITVKQWREFNATCTQLREFHWVVVPFADPFFKVFGKHVKPKLKKLTFANNLMWKWEQYFDMLKETAEAPLSSTRETLTQRRGYGGDATDVSSALKGCPALEDLAVKLYHPNYEVDEDTAELEEFVLEGIVNIDIYGNKFCETIAKYCPWLTKFCILEVAEGHNSHLTPIRTFTDQGLVALANLKYLTLLELRPINCTGNGLFNFLDSLSNEFMGQRTLQICVGGHLSLAFYEVVRDLLNQLNAKSSAELGWGRRKFVLRLLNSNYDSVKPEWSEQYLSSLEHVAEGIEKTHPTLRLRITTVGRRGQTFKRINELGLYTTYATPSLWYDWCDKKNGQKATFVDRRDDEVSIFDHDLHTLPLELRHPELLNPDLLPLDYELPMDYFEATGGYGDYDDYYEEDYRYDDGYDGYDEEFWE